MNWISTKELSEKWGISERRILYLTKEGRIPGAKLVGKTWLYPENCEKPADKRTQTRRNEQNEVSFHFPLYAFTSYSATEMENEFTEDEKYLYQAEMEHYSGNFKKAYSMFHEILQSTTNHTVKIGTIFFLCKACLMLGYYSELISLYKQFEAIFAIDFSHKKELEYIYHDLETYLSGNSYFLDEFAVSSDYQYHPTSRNYILLLSAYSAMIKAITSQNRISDPSVYDMTLQILNGESTPAFKVHMHTYTAALSFIAGNNQNGMYHITKALDIGKDHHMLYPIAYMYKYAPKTFEKILQLPEYKDADVIRDYSRDFFTHIVEFLNYKENTPTITALDSQELHLIYYLMLGFSNTDIARHMHLSLSSVTKKLSVLYQKADVKGRNELIQFARESMGEY